MCYHLHSDLSNGVTNVDSVTKYGEYIERAKECGMKALAFSEHGSVFEWYHKKTAIENAGMKYIHAIVAVGGDLAEAHPAIDLHGLHLLMNQLLDRSGFPDILDHQDRAGFVRGGDGDGTDAKDPLKEAAGEGNIPDPVEKDFLVLQIQHTRGAEQTVLGNGVFRKAQGQTEVALAVTPEQLVGGETH